MELTISRQFERVPICRDQASELSLRLDFGCGGDDVEDSRGS